jgi:hypothetical protein
MMSNLSKLCDWQSQVVKTHHATREFRADSIFSETRRPDDSFSSCPRTRGRHVVTGGVPIRETTTSDYGCFHGGAMSARPCTAGLRINPWSVQPEHAV